MEFENKVFSVSKVIETGTNFERINRIDLNVNGFAIASIVYYYINESNKPKNEITVHFHYTDMLDYDFDCSHKLINFFDDYIGEVTRDENDIHFSHNLFYHMINHMWLPNENFFNEFDLDITKYFPKTHYCFQYNDKRGIITRKIKVIIH